MSGTSNQKCMHGRVRCPIMDVRLFVLYHSHVLEEGFYSTGCYQGFRGANIQGWRYVARLHRPVLCLEEVRLDVVSMHEHQAEWASKQKRTMSSPPD